MEMIEVKTSKLVGSALDWATGKAAGIDVVVLKSYGCGMLVYKDAGDPGYRQPENYRPSTDWAQCGQLIEKFKVSLLFIDDHWWVGFNVSPYEEYSITMDNDFSHDQPLVAACRAIVAAKLGDAVCVPAELITTAAPAA